MDDVLAPYVKLSHSERQAIIRGAQLGSHPQSIHALGREARAVLQQLSRQVMALFGLSGRGYHVLWFNTPGEAMWQLCWGIAMGVARDTQVLVHPIAHACQHLAWQQVQAAMCQHFPAKKWLWTTSPSPSSLESIRIWAVSAQDASSCLPASYEQQDWLLVDGLALEKPTVHWSQLAPGRCIFLFRRLQQRGIAGLTCLVLPTQLPIAPMLGQGSLTEESLLLGTPPIGWLAGQLELLNALR